MFFLELILAVIVIGAIFVGPYFVARYFNKTTDNGAPWVPMEADVVERVLKMADVKEGDTFYELGSGDGRLVLAAAIKGANAVGIEIDKWRVLYSRFWIWFLRLGDKAKIIEKDIFEQSYEDATVVCLYLLQETNEKIQKKLEKELKPGTRVISVAFTFPGWKLEREDPRGTIYGPIYLYKR